MIESDAKCLVCGSTSLRERPFGYVFNSRWLGARECRECGIIFVYPQPSEEEIAQLYSKEYFEGDFRCGHAGSYFDEATLSGLGDRALINRIKKHVSSGEFLEVGCAGGAFLHAAREAGFSVKGVEYSEEAAHFARQRFGLDVIAGDLRRAGYPPNSLDVVFMGDVLEHLLYPVTTLNEINRVLKPGGLLVLACPSQTNTLFSRFGFAVYATLGKETEVNLPPYHLFEYRPKSMKHILLQCGFEVVRLSQKMIPPQEVALRGTKLQRLGKRVFQYPNYLLNIMFGILGDRLEVFARKAIR